MRATLCLDCGRAPHPSCEGRHRCAYWYFHRGITPAEFRNVAVFELVIMRERAANRRPDRWDH